MTETKRGVCPKCGSPDGVKVDETTDVRGTTRPVFECGFERCRFRYADFSEATGDGAETESDYVVYSRTARCPYCASKSTKVTRTIQRTDYVVRYHKCDECSLPFTSNEPGA